MCKYDRSLLLGYLSLKKKQQKKMDAYKNAQM